MLLRRVSMKGPLEKFVMKLVGVADGSKVPLTDKRRLVQADVVISDNRLGVGIPRQNCSHCPSLQTLKTLFACWNVTTNYLIRGRPLETQGGGAGLFPSDILFISSQTGEFFFIFLRIRAKFFYFWKWVEKIYLFIFPSRNEMHVNSNY